jgi:hypothetical protein
MRKLAWAALLSLPLLAVSQQKASADGGFCWVHDFCQFRLKLCAQCYGNGCCGPCHLGGHSRDHCGPAFDECHGIVPGPWYTYWPYDGAPFMTSPYNFPAWVYDDNFKYGAPSPYPFSGATATHCW